MSNLKRFAVSPTGRLHLRGPGGELLYAFGPGGKPDKKRPIAANVYGPGSKEYAKARAVQDNELVAAMKGGKSERSVEEKAESGARFLTAITRDIENLFDDEPVTTDRDKIMEQYLDRETGFVADQVAAYVNDWANFKKPSTSS